MRLERYPRKAASRQHSRKAASKTGGRGASSGVSVKGKLYGSEYATLYQSGNIKFVRPNIGATTPPMETMTKGGVYVTVDPTGKPKSVVYYDKSNKRYKQVDIDHTHFVNGQPTKPHTHKGYVHNERGDRKLSPKEEKMVERILKTWYNRRSK